MDNLQEKTNPSSDRPSFFGLPAGFRVWSLVGGQFWGGVLCGVGIGIFGAAVLVDLELTTLRLTPRVAAIVIAFWLIGQIIAFRALRRAGQAEKNEPQKM